MPHFSKSGPHCTVLLCNQGTSDRPITPDHEPQIVLLALTFLLVGRSFLVENHLELDVTCLWLGSSLGWAWRWLCEARSSISEAVVEGCRASYDKPCSSTDNRVEHLFC